MINVISQPPANPQGRIPIHLRWFVVDCPAIFGQSIGELRIRKLSGCTVMTISRSGVFVHHPDRHFVLVEGDQLCVAGTNAQLAFFERAFGMSCYINTESSFHQIRIA